MNIHTLNIALEDPEMLYVTKHQLETARIERDKTYKRKSLNDFVTDCEIKNVYVNENYNTIPFGIKKETNDDIWVFYCVSLEDNKIFDELMSVLESIGFDLKRLYEVPLESLYTGKMDGMKHFIMNNKNYTIKKL